MQQNTNFQNLTYDQLFIYIQQYLSRTDQLTIANIPNWINLAEKQLAIRLKNLGNVNVLNVAVQANQNLIDTAGVLIKKPYLWHTTKSVSLLKNGRRDYLLPRAYEYLQQYLNDFSGLDSTDVATTLPQYYCDYNQEYWLIGPYLDDKPVDIEVAYYGQVPPLSPDNQVNFWTSYAPYALLYGVLCEACTFLRSDDRLAMFQPKYEMALTDLLGEGASRVNDNTIVRQNS